jgi:hypothetical protein
VSDLVIGMSTGMPVAVAIPVSIAIPMTVGAGLDIENRTPAGIGAASANIKGQKRFRDPAGRLEMVIVGQFFAGIDRPAGKDVDAAIFVQSFAVGIAGVIDIAGIVSADRAVDSGGVINRKEERMMAFHRFFVVALGFESRPDPLADILNDPLPFADTGESECATSLNAGLTDNE